MTDAEMKDLTRELYEQGINDRDEEALGRILAPDARSDTPFPEDESGSEGFKEVYRTVIAAFPDYKVTIEDQIAEGDEVATRFTARGTHEGDFMGIPATGRRIELTGIDINRIKDGRIAEHWGEASIATLLLRLGGGSASATG